MPLNKVPRYLNPGARRLVEAALEDAWKELGNGRHVDAEAIRAKLRRAMVGLAAVSETNPGKLKRLATHAWRVGA